MPKKGISDTRKFDGKKFTYSNYAMSRKGAKGTVETMKKSGRMRKSTKTRIVTRKGTDGKTYYLIYKRGK